jgi:predicted ATPase
LHAGASLKGLDDLLASALLSPPQADQPDAVSSFEPEFAEDAERFVGRQGEIDALTDRLGRSAQGERLLWLHGTAGMGKSFLMARLFETLRASATPKAVLIPYRFRRGDPRCSSALFAELVCAALDNRLAAIGR